MSSYSFEIIYTKSLDIINGSKQQKLELHNAFFGTAVWEIKHDKACCYSKIISNK